MSDLPPESYGGDLLRGIFRSVRTIAVVGASADPARPSHYVTLYLQQLGYRIVPVNPGLAGQRLFGEPVFPSLESLPERPDMVDIFRNSRDAGPVATAAAELGVPVIWMQMGVRNDAAAARARALGATVVMDRCPKVEYPRLFRPGGHRE